MTPQREAQKAEAQAKSYLDQALTEKDGDPEFKMLLTDLGAAVVGKMAEYAEDCLQRCFKEVDN